MSSAEKILHPNRGAGARVLAWMMCNHSRRFSLEEVARDLSLPMKAVRDSVSRSLRENIGDSQRHLEHLSQTNWYWHKSPRPGIHSTVPPVEISMRLMYRDTVNELMLSGKFTTAEMARNSDKSDSRARTTRSLSVSGQGASDGVRSPAIADGSGLLYKQIGTTGSGRILVRSESGRVFALQEID